MRWINKEENFIRSMINFCTFFSASCKSSNFRKNEKETKHFKIQYIFPQRLTTEGEAGTEPEGAGEPEGEGEAETEEVVETVEMVSFFKKN